MRYVYVVIIIVLLLNISGHFKVAFIFGEVAITIYMLHSLYVIIKEIIKEKKNERETKLNSNQNIQVTETTVKESEK